MSNESLAEQMARIVEDVKGRKARSIPRCPSCNDTGWEYVKSNAVVACSQGCTPPPPAMKVRPAPKPDESRKEF